MMANSNTVYLLGSGFTKAICNEAPLNNELLKKVIENGGITLEKWREKFNKNDIDIEELLTRVDLDAVLNDEAKVDRKVIEREIAEYFRRFRFPITNYIIPDWLQLFGKQVLKNNDSIITLNYDCLLEGVLDYLRVWTPNGGYGDIGGALRDKYEPSPYNITIYKVHGSENFGESPVYDDTFGRTGIQICGNNEIFPFSGESNTIGAGVGSTPCIIAPSFIKIPHVKIHEIMLQSLDVALSAPCMVIIGCGMRQEDIFVWQLLWRFLDLRSEKRKKLILFDPQAERIYRNIVGAWAGALDRFHDVNLIPKGMAEGCQELLDMVNPQ